MGRKIKYLIISSIIVMVSWVIQERSINHRAIKHSEPDILIIYDLLLYRMCNFMNAEYYFGGSIYLILMLFD